MKTKKRLIITLGSLVAAVSLVVVAIVAIFAAQSQGVTSTFKIRYRAVNISATVEANYIVGGEYVPLLTDDGEDSLVFRPDSLEGGSLTPVEDEIELDVDTNSVVFEYIFTNNSNEKDVAIALDTTSLTNDNMSIGYAYAYHRVTDVNNMPTDYTFEPMMILGEGKELGQYNKLYVYMKISVDNTANDAYFEGSIDFSLTQETPVKLDFTETSILVNDLLFEDRMIPANVNIERLPHPIVSVDEGMPYTLYANQYDDLISFPLKATSDVNVYFAQAPYAISYADDGKSVTIETFDYHSSVYVSLESGNSFSYSSTRHIVESNQYIIVRPASKVILDCEFAFEELKGKIEYSPRNDVEYEVLFSKPDDIDDRSFYTSYGEFPQAYVGNELNEILQNATLRTTGKTYSIYNDSSSPLNYVEYEYLGKKYVKLDYIFPYETEFSTGDIVDSHSWQDVFFEVEPIVVRAVECYQDDYYIFMVNNMLAPSVYSEYGYPWDDSTLKNYLNNSFASDTGLASVSSDFRIASVEELLTWTGSADGIEILYEDDFYSDENDGKRLVVKSDFARGTSLDGNNTYGVYWIRTQSGGVFTVNVSGGINWNAYSMDYRNVGFCAVFTMRHYDVFI